MSEYHVGCGAFGIYAGTLNSRNKNMWKNKSECTDEALCAVRDYMVQELLGGIGCNKAVSSGYEWDLKDGRVVELRVTIRTVTGMDEYIERKALREAFDNADADVVEEYEDGDCDWGFGRQNILEVINSVPSADVAQVLHGRWIEYTKVIIPEPYNKWEQAWKCSECGFDDGFVAYNYCPNCGAKMECGNDG